MIKLEKVSFKFLLGISLIILLAMSIWGQKNILDAKFFYSKEEAETFFSMLSASDEHKYLITALLDLGLLSTYTLCSLKIATKLFFKTNKLWWALIPGFFDLIETSTIILILSKNLTMTPAWLGYITLAKWISIFFLIGTFIQISLKAKKNAK